MDQSTPRQGQVDPDQRENPVPMSVEQPVPDGPVPEWIPIEDDEVMIWEGAQSSKQLLPDLAMSLVLAGVGAVLVSIGQFQIFRDLPSTFQLLATVTGLIFVVLAVGSFGYNYWSHRNRRYAITTEATYRKWGDYISKIEMGDIASVTHQRFSWVDRLFSCGDLKIQWQKNGRQSTTYPAVPHPAQVQDIIMDGAYDREKDSPR